MLRWLSTIYELPPSYDTAPALAVDLNYLDVLYTDGATPAEASGITIDWTPQSESVPTFASTSSTDNWLIDFLGLAEPAPLDLAQMTGLVVRWIRVRQRVMARTGASTEGEFGNWR